MDFFDFIFTGTSIFGKARQIQGALQKNHIAKENTLYVGDEIRDIQACQKLSIPIISVTWGFNTKQALQQYHPDYVISSPEKLLDIL